MTSKEMYKYKDWIFVKDEAEGEVSYYSMEEDDYTGFWRPCAQYDYLQAKYYGKPVRDTKILIEQKESLK